MMINGAGGIRLRMDNHWANEEAVELVPENGKKAEMNRFSKSGCCVWDKAINRVAEEKFACYLLAAGWGKNPRCWLPIFARN